VAVARALSLPETAVVRCWFAGVGLRFCFVQLTDQDMVDRATLDTSAWRVGLADGWSPHLYVFAGDFRDGQRLYSRFFAPAIGVAEDPAAGSACVTIIGHGIMTIPGRNRQTERAADWWARRAAWLRPSGR
jgi:trans-2,3-dihydro-3-hydroxyanthranilate isomerase